MAKFLFYLVLVVALLGGTFRLSLESPGIQNAVTEQIAWVAMKRRAEGLPNPDSLRLFMCGTASPLGNSDRAQACVAVLTPHHFYIVDSGAGSTARLTAAGLPVERMQAVLLTHFHSDHIAELYELNLVSWVAGRPEPLKIYGPRGVRNVVRGVNETYEMDRQYRMAHHGIDILPEHLGELSHQFLEANTILEDGDLTITAWQTHHDPASPALGYRFDFRGRSVVISGDSTVTDDTRRVTKGVDLLLHDALSKPLMTGMVKAAEAAGLKRRAKIMVDVMDYHASTDSIIALAEEVNVRRVAYYHLVPTPGNFILEQAFKQNMPENFVVAGDGDWFDLPSASAEVNLIKP